MPLAHAIALLAVLVLPGAPELLQEPEYMVARDGDSWVVRKPGLGGRPPLEISRHATRNAAEFRRRSLPRVRLSGLFVRFFRPETVIADWTGQADARQVQADVREILDRFASGAARVLQATPVRMARLNRAAGRTAEDSADSKRLVIYLDPFRATGRLHAAATLVHELTHVERYGARGFHANRAAAVLPKRDFVLLGLADELFAYQAEASLLRAFLAGQPDEETRRAARQAMTRPELNWPMALTALLGLEGDRNVRRQVLLDLERVAASYWDARHLERIDPRLAETIRLWHKKSHEWRQMAAERAEWERAKRDVNLGIVGLGNIGSGTMKDLERVAASYWDARHLDGIDPRLAAERAEWQRARR